MYSTSSRLVNSVNQRRYCFYLLIITVAGVLYSNAYYQFQSANLNITNSYDVKSSNDIIETNLPLLPPNDLNIRLWKLKNNENGGSMTYEQYYFIGSTISFNYNIHKSPGLNVLIFSVGYDSIYWYFWNQHGRTVFIENNQEWLTVAKNDFYEQITYRQNISSVQMNKDYLEIYFVNYTTWMDTDEWGNNSIVNNFNKLNEFYSLQLPSNITNNDTYWDVIIVDAPNGFWKNTPGRMQSIFAAYRLAINALQIIDIVHIFVHDYGRKVEKKYCNVFFGAPQTVIHPPKTSDWRKQLAYFQLDRKWLTLRFAHRLQGKSYS